MHSMLYVSSKYCFCAHPSAPTSFDKLSLYFHFTAVFHRASFSFVFPPFRYVLWRLCGLRLLWFLGLKLNGFKQIWKIPTHLFSREILPFPHFLWHFFLVFWCKYLLNFVFCLSPLLMLGSRFFQRHFCVAFWFIYLYLSFHSLIFHLAVSHFLLSF